jgi:hypothetical protein
VRSPLRWFRASLVAVASSAVVLAACAGQTSGDVEAPGSQSASETERPGDGSDPDDSSDPDDDRGLEVTDPSRADDAGDDDTRQVSLHEPAPAPAEPYELSPDEMLPATKRLASDVVQQLLTYEPQDTPRETVGAAVGEDGVPDLLVKVTPLMHRDAWSRGEIVYPQLGGFTDTSASVMVVARQSVGLPDGRTFEESRTFDVRLAIEDGDWVFDDLASVGGRPVERPADLSAAATAVVDDERIELPDTARWDIYRGVIQEPLLELMSLIADRTDYGVIVLDTGHPWEVFGTDRQSRHSKGRAVDLYRLDGPNVIDDREEGSGTHEFVQWLYEQPEMTNMGSPWALDDFGGRSFTDDLHQDHLHIESRAEDDA